MNHEITGTIVFIGQTAQVTEKFRKREVVIKTDDTYPQQCIFQLLQDRVSLLDTCNLGDKMEINFHVQGREWKSPKDGAIRYFNSLNINTIKCLEAAPSSRDNDNKESELSARLKQEADDLATANGFMDKLEKVAPETKPIVQSQQDDLPF